MPVKVTGPSGAASDPNIAAGIVWAVDHGAKVTSISLSAAGASEVLQKGVDDALGHDVVVVASAGNRATDVPSTRPPAGGWWPSAPLEGGGGVDDARPPTVEPSASGTPASPALTPPSRP